MIKLYTVNYKPTDWKDTTEMVSVVAHSLAKAVEGAGFVIRKRHGSNREIVSVGTQQKIDRVER